MLTLTKVGIVELLSFLGIPALIYVAGVIFTRYTIIFFYESSDSVFYREPDTIVVASMLWPLTLFGFLPIYLLAVYVLLPLDARIRAFRDRKFCQECRQRMQMEADRPVCIYCLKKAELSITDKEIAEKRTPLTKEQTLHALTSPGSFDYYLLNPETFELIPADRLSTKPLRKDNP